MELVTGAMGSLLPKLGELLKEQYNLQKGVREKIKTLSAELEIVNAVLRDIGEVPWDQVDERGRFWVRDMREASYDMEDIVDTFLVRVDGHEPTDPHMLMRLQKKIGDLFKKSKARRKINSMIRDINKKLEEVKVRHGRYTADNIVAKPVAAMAIDPRVLNLYKSATELVGIDGPRDELINKLSLGGDVDVSDNKMKIVSIVGSGGLGKTTLAKAVYEQLKPRFECSAFVPVGRNPDMKKVFRDILFDLDKKTYTYSELMMLDEKQLIDILKGFVQENRSFIVIDDIWEKKSWKLIRCALQDSNNGSRVVVTTRIFEVATHAGDVYKIQPLSRDDSEKLLYARIVDGDGKYLDRPSAEACDKILKKCNGVPLAIITIASLLASKPGEDWSEIYNSIGFGHGGNDDVENTRRILSFSYYDLSSYLKACLLYLSIFPEDAVIEKNGLIWKWIAEGFIHEEQAQAAGVGLFELGERYFNELINRSMIHPVEPEDKGFVDGCHVHDMVHDLVRSLSSQQNFVTLLDDNEKQKLPRRIARRLALQRYDPSDDVLAHSGVEKVRSFIVRECDFDRLPRQPFLRVLDITDSCLPRNSKYPWSLLHLRYLRIRIDYFCKRIRIDYFCKLPREVGDLKFLQTLNIVAYVAELPEEVGQLTQLVCLRVGSKRGRKVNLRPGLISKLTSLQELWIWPRDVSGLLKELGMLRELRVLHTCIDANEDESMERALLESLGNLHNIQTVDIEGCPSLGKGGTRDAGLFTSYRQLRHLRLECFVFSGLPVWIKSSLAPNLSHLYLKVLAVKEQDMETLGRLPELCFLELRTRNTILVNIEICTEGVVYFRKLKILRIFGSSLCFGLHGSECNSSSSIGTTTMPSLESITFEVHVRLLKAATSFENLGRTSLQWVTAEINCRGACPSDLKDAEDALLHAATVHPKRPILTLHHKEGCMDVSRTWKLADIVASGHIQELHMPDPESSGKVIRLLYANAGTSLLALGSNGVHKLWKWQYSCGVNPHGTSITSVPPHLWQPANGLVMTNDTSDFNPEEAAACNALSKNGSYLISASGGKVSLFNLTTFKIMATFMATRPAATFLAFYPEDNNIIAVGMEDASIRIYNVRIDDDESKLVGHQKKITGLAFSQSMNVLVSSGADAQLCVWSIASWKKRKTTYIRPPFNDSGALDGDTMVQFHCDQTYLLVVHESQLAVYDGELECLRLWSPRDGLPAPVSSAVYSSDGLLVYAGFYDGAVGIFEAESLRLQCRIAPSAYIPSSISSVYPMVVAAHPWKPYQIAVGMSNGAVHILEPLDTDATVGSNTEEEERPPGEISSGGGGSQQQDV